MNYCCVACGHIASFPSGRVDLCSCGTSPLDWFPLRVESPAPEPPRLRSVRFRLVEGQGGGAILGLCSVLELLDALKAKYGARLAWYEVTHAMRLRDEVVCGSPLRHAVHYRPDGRPCPSAGCAL